MDICNVLPEGMIVEHGDITLVVEIMYINEIPLVMMRSQAIHFRTAELIKNKRISTIMIALRQVMEA